MNTVCTRNRVIWVKLCVCILYKLSVLDCYVWQARLGHKGRYLYESVTDVSQSILYRVRLTRQENGVQQKVTATASKEAQEANILWCSCGLSSLRCVHTSTVLPLHAVCSLSENGPFIILCYFFTQYFAVPKACTLQ